MTECDDKRCFYHLFWGYRTASWSPSSVWKGLGRVDRVETRGFLVWPVVSYRQLRPSSETWGEKKGFVGLCAEKCEEIRKSFFSHRMHMCKTWMRILAIACNVQQWRDRDAIRFVGCFVVCRSLKTYKLLPALTRLKWEVNQVKISTELNWKRFLFFADDLLLFIFHVSFYSFSFLFSCSAIAREDRRWDVVCGFLRAATARAHTHNKMRESE